MTNKILIVIACVALAGTLPAQSFFGPKLGATLASVDYDWSGEPEVDVESNVQLQIGLALDLGIVRNFSIQPEFSYIGRSYTTRILGVELTRRIASVDLGALAKIRFRPDEGIGFYLGAGPYVTYAISGTDDLSIGGEVDIDFDDEKIRRTDVSVAGALGLTFNIGGPLIFIDGRYILGLNDIDDASDEITVKNRTIAASLGFMVPLN